MTTGAVSTAVGYENIPESMRSVDTIDRPDYVDLFTLRTPAASKHSAEAWGRAIIEQSPVGRRWARVVWHALGLVLAPPGTPGYLHGWRIADRGDDWIRIETRAWFATAHAVCRVDDDSVSVSLFLRYEHPLARILWPPVGAMHRRGVPLMLRQAPAVLGETAVAA